MPRLATIFCSALAMLALSAPGASAAVGGPLTDGPNYDRNPTVVQHGAATYMFFTRTQGPCNRLDGCDPDNGPSAKYDLWFRKSLDGGDHFGPEQLAATNPEPLTGFRGRTIAAVSDGSRLRVFWADGGSEEALYEVVKAPAGDSFSAPTQVVGAQSGVFNVEAVVRGSQVILYTEGGAPAQGVYARPYAAGAAGPPTLVQLGRNIPKAIVDRRGVVRLTYVDGDWPDIDVYVNSSADGLNFASERLVVEAEDNDSTNWDPNLAQTRNGRYYLTFAPDRGDGRQQIAVTASKDFVRWTEERTITPAEQGGTEYWDYWPEGFVQDKGNDLALFYASERGFDGNPVGTGHIWALPGDDHDRGWDFGGRDGFGD
jgi:hypothetical protein